MSVTKNSLQGFGITVSPALESEQRSPRERMGSGKAVKEGDFFPTDFMMGPKVPQSLVHSRSPWSPKRGGGGVGG